jgi:hypothetical protein
MDGPALPYGHSHSEGATFVHNDRIWMVAGHTTPEGEKKKDVWKHINAWGGRRLGAHVQGPEGNVVARR